MNILHLVLYHDEEPYRSMVQSSLTWYQKFESRGVSTFYYCYDEKVEEIVFEEGHIMRIPGKETFTPGILEKTLEALRFFFGNPETATANLSLNVATTTTQHEHKYDFVVRSNASSLLDFNKILRTLEARKDSLMYGGLHIISMPSPWEFYDKEDNDLYPLLYSQGTCIVLHKKAVEVLMTNYSKIKRIPIDDISIALYLKRLSTNDPTQYPATLWAVQSIGDQYLNFSLNSNLDHIYAFRNMTRENRANDIVQIREEAEAWILRYDTLPTLVLQRVMYGSMDITSSIVLICKASLTRSWQSDGSNATFDYLFGDPAHGAVKLVKLEFQPNKHGISKFQNTACWNFVLRSSGLYAE